MNISLRRLVTLSAFTVALFALAVAGFLSWQRTRARLENETYDQMRRIGGLGARLAAALPLNRPATPAEASAAPGLPDEAPLNALARLLNDNTGYRASFIDSQGRLLADSGPAPEKSAHLENHLKRPEVAQALAGGLGRIKRFSASEGQEYLYLAQAFSLEDGSRLVLRLGRPFRQLAAERDQLFQHYVVAALGALALAIIFSQGLGRLIFRPIGEITAAAKALSQGDLGYRIRHYPANELAELGLAFDRMAGRLASQIALTAQSRDYLQTVLATTQEGVLVTDSRGRITLANPAFRNMFGLAGSLEGLTPAEAVRTPRFIEAFQQAAQGRKVSETLIVLSAPQARTLEVSINPIIKEGSEFSGGLVAVFHDLTSRQKLYQMRRDLVANISHELRTPLTALMAAVETLKEQPPSEAGAFRKFIDIIDRQSQRLNALAQSLLQLASLEAPPGETKPGRFTLSTLIASLEERAAGCLRPAGRPLESVRLLIKRPPEEINLAGDLETLLLALTNLIDNAVRHGPPAQTVTVSFAATTENLIIEVADQGPGIPPAERERIFERFYRPERSRNRSRGGAGLGLALVKHAIRRHYGEVVFKPGSEGGSVFQITLPRR